MKKKEPSEENLNAKENSEGKNNMKETKTGQEENKAEAAEEEISKEERLERQMAETQAQLADAKDKYVRLYAEFENYKKRIAKERMEWIKTAGTEVIAGLLPVLDDFERGLKQLENIQEVQPVKAGKLLIYNKLRALLEQRGLKVMDSVGKEFNPDLHDAISEVPAPREDMKGKILDEIEKGYYLNDVIIRHAKVVVGK